MVLGICGGCQLINVARGGSLIQDIPSAIGGQIRHRGTPTAPAEHDIDVLAGTGLAGHVGAGRLRVNSAHHQAVGRLGQGLRVTARPCALPTRARIRRTPRASRTSCRACASRPGRSRRRRSPGPT
jgi:hypothetical protein